MSGLAAFGGDRSIEENEVRSSLSCEQAASTPISQAFLNSRSAVSWFAGTPSPVRYLKPKNVQPVASSAAHAFVNDLIAAAMSLRVPRPLASARTLSAALRDIAFASKRKQLRRLRQVSVGEDSARGFHSERAAGNTAAGSSTTACFRSSNLRARSGC